MIYRMKSKTCKTFEEANRFYLNLCERHESVKLIRSPMFTEEGIYTWEVSAE